jgi:mannonate dehydratase
VHAVQSILDGLSRHPRQCAIPGVVNAYGVGRGFVLRAGKKGRSRAYGAGATSFVPPLFERLRREVGFDVHLLHDVHHRLTPIEAARLGKPEPYRLFWLEDPVPVKTRLPFARSATTRPRRSLWRSSTPSRLSAAHRRGADRHIRMTVVHGGGITICGRLPRWRTASRPNRIARRDRSGPVSLAAALLDLSVHNFGIQEQCGTRRRPTRVSSCYRFENGAMHRQSQGWASHRWILAAQYPREGLSSREPQTDGTVHSW